jgi:hypothetical protein
MSEITEEMKAAAREYMEAECMINEGQVRLTAALRILRPLSSRDAMALFEQVKAEQEQSAEGEEEGE